MNGDAGTVWTGPSSRRRGTTDVTTGILSRFNDVACQEIYPRKLVNYRLEFVTLSFDFRGIAGDEETI